MLMTPSPFTSAVGVTAASPPNAVATMTMSMMLMTPSPFTSAGSRGGNVSKVTSVMNGLPAASVTSILTTYSRPTWIAAASSMASCSRASSMSTEATSSTPSRRRLAPPPTGSENTSTTPVASRSAGSSAVAPSAGSEETSAGGSMSSESCSIAATTSTRPAPHLSGSSPAALPAVSMSAWRTSSAERCGSLDTMSAAAPATIGVAWLVPALPS